MRKVIEFLRAVPAFYVSTTDENNRPRVRPFSLVYEWEGKLSFGTRNIKEVYRQLQNNPYVEICAFHPDKGAWMRVSGKVRLFRDVEANRYILKEVMPALKELYGDENNPEMVNISLEEGQADMYYFGSVKPKESIKL